MPCSDREVLLPKHPNTSMHTFVFRTLEEWWWRWFCGVGKGEKMGRGVLVQLVGKEDSPKQCRVESGV